MNEAIVKMGGYGMWRMRLMIKDNTSIFILISNRLQTTMDRIYGNLSMRIIALRIHIRWCVQRKKYFIISLVGSILASPLTWVDFINILTSKMYGRICQEIRKSSTLIILSITREYLIILQGLKICSFFTRY